MAGDFRHESEETMTINRSLIAVVAGILAISVAVGAAPASAAHTAPASFELTFEGWPGGGEFTASGAFCPSGRVETLRYAAQSVQLLSCADGSGTATALVALPDYWTTESGTWRIVGGSGTYEKLRGQGRLAIVDTGDRDLVCDEFLGCEEVPVVRTAWTGVAALDDVPPALRIVSAQPSRLSPPGTYSLELALELRDQVDGAPVPYLLRVTSGLRGLAWISGTAETESIALTVPIRPGKRALSVRVHLSASDALGNESSLSSPMIVLPR
jgi:hypothetical protein